MIIAIWKLWRHIIMIIASCAGTHEPILNNSIRKESMKKFYNKKRLELEAMQFETKKKKRCKTEDL